MMKRRKPEMESTNSPLMNSLVNFIVGVFTKDSEAELPLQSLPISLFFFGFFLSVLSSFLA